MRIFYVFLCHLKLGLTKVKASFIVSISKMNVYYILIQTFHI